MKLDEPISRLFFPGESNTEPLVDKLEREWWKPEVRASYEHKLSGAFWLASRKDTADALKQLLDVPLSDVCVGGWKKYQEIMKYADTARFPPERRAEVSLGEHTIKSAHKPAIEITLGGRPLPPIELEVVFSLKLAAGVLAIQNAAIRAIRVGACEFKGEIKLLKGGVVQPLVERKFEFPGVFEPPGGIPLR